MVGPLTCPALLFARTFKMYRDLRQLTALVDERGALRGIAGADPRFEIGGITEVAAGLPDCPALLFDSIKGYPPGFRLFTNRLGRSVFTQPGSGTAGRHASGTSA